MAKDKDSPESQRARKIAAALARTYPDAECALNHKSPLQLLLATILSAQCTDARVNLVTPELFRRYPTAAALAAAKQEEVERIIQSTGFFRAKATSLRGACAAIAEKHAGEVPQSLDELTALPGVGRKTANVVLGTAFGEATGVVVDTHVRRISRRLGLTKHNDPVKIEADLMRLLPRKDWIDFSHRLIHHGRQICLARKPRCEVCSLNKLCPKVGVETSE